MFSSTSGRRCVWVNGPVIVGAGPSGMAVAAGLKQHGVPFVILERADCIASLWQRRTYDRLKLHFPKNSYQLPQFPFPAHYPDELSKDQFIEYLENYAAHFDINPIFNEGVQSARYDEACGLWRVRTVSTTTGEEVEYICRWLVVASGEHADPTEPKIEGMKELFRGGVIHTCEYKSGEKYRGKDVLVVGCGISGMEVSLDLCNHGAKPFMVVRGSIDVYLKVIDETIKSDEIHVWLSEIRDKIRSKEIQLVPAINRFWSSTVQFVDRKHLPIDSVVLATGYHSNVPTWLQEREFFSDKGLPKKPFPNGWKGRDGLYAVGFTMTGLYGVSVDAVKISQDIVNIWKDEVKQKNREVPTHKR